MQALMSEGRRCHPQVTAPGVGRSTEIWNTFGAAASGSDVLQAGTFVIPPLDYGDSVRFSKIEDLVRSFSGRKVARGNQNSSMYGADQQPPPGQETMQDRAPEMVTASGQAQSSGDFFICQFKNARFNPNGGSAATNNDCGPTSLAMAARLFGKVDPSLPPDAAISDSRFKMTGANFHENITSYDQIQAGATGYGLRSHYIGFSGLDDALARGEKVIFDGNPGNSYGNRMSASDYFKYNGGHFMLVLSRTANGYLIADPNSKVGLLEISRAEMWDFANWGAGSAGLALSA